LSNPDAAHCTAEAAQRAAPLRKTKKHAS